MRYRDLTAALTLDPMADGTFVHMTVHEGFEPGSILLAGVSGGRPAISSALKTSLETGANVSVEMAAE